MPGLTAFLDASVLYPAPLRDFLMYLTLTDVYRAKWSQQVHTEWIEALLRTRPELPRTQLERTRDLMNLHVEDALVEEFEHLIDGLTLPDPNDRHVLAAAIKSRSNLIITNNLKDFPSSVLAVFDIEAIHPDIFVLRLLEVSPQDVVSAAAEQRQNLKNPPKSVTDYLATLERQGLTGTVARLREYAVLI